MKLPSCTVPYEKLLTSIYFPCIGPGIFPDKILSFLNCVVLYTFFNPTDSRNPTDLVNKEVVRMNESSIICSTMLFNRHKFHTDPVVFPGQSVACSLSNFWKAMAGAVTVEFL